MSTIRRRFFINDVLTDMTSVVLRDPTDTFGVRRNDTSAVVVAAGTAMVHVATGTYEYTFDDPAADLTYTYYLEVGYGGETYYVEHTLLGPTSGTELVNQANLRDYIRRQLGWPTVQVELTEAQLDDSINDALRLFNRYLQVRRYNVASGREGGTYLELASAVTGVYHVSFVLPRTDRDILNMSLFEILSRMAYPPFQLGEWYMLRVYHEMFQRVRGSDPSWRYDQDSRRLYLDAWSGPYDVCYVTAENLTLETVLTGSQRRYQTEFLEAAVAYSKGPLAKVRGKFGGIPAPAGALTTDASTLSEERDNTLERIRGVLARRMRTFYMPSIG